VNGWLDALTRGHEAHLWYVLSDQIEDDGPPATNGLLAAYRALLSPAEHERNGRFVFEKGRREHLITRALVRTTLSRYVPAVDPRAWQFAIGPFGRPEIEGPVVAPRLRFNLSHSDGAIVCLVAVEHDVGVDVENTSRSGIIGMEIADRYFAPSEVSELRSLPATDQPSRFFDYWTLKEAYIKGRGLGLQLPLDQFSFHLAGADGAARNQRTASDESASGRDEPPIRILFGPQIADDPASWQFQRDDLTPHHRLAIAIRRGRAAPDLTVKRWPVVPLRTP